MNNENKSAPISIITATYNAAKHLPKLVESLLAQTDQDFEWVVADGGSTDETLAILEKAKQQLKNVVIDSRPDFGIYDALNRAVKLTKCKYYIVLGADDELLPYGVQYYKSERDIGNMDFVTCRFHAGDRVLDIRRPRWEFLYSQLAHVTGHAVGLMIRKDLHAKVGFYSRKFPIAADQHFILKALKTGASIRESQLVVGKYGVNGASNADAVGALIEIFRVNLDLGHNLFVQMALLFFRLIKIKAAMKHKQNNA